MFKKYNIGFDLDDPRAGLIHRDIILRKPFLRRWYRERYTLFIRRSKEMEKGLYVEIGSGGGFLKDVFPEVITSDIMPLPNVDRVFSAEALPFKNEELGTLVMLNVFHHIPKPYLFLKEAERTLLPGGKIIMVEPANSLLGRFIYKRFHHEPFDENGPREIAPGNPLSNSNQALPYIYFERDRVRFERDFPELKINTIRYHSPFTYLASGGLSRSALLPYFLYRPLRFVEWFLTPFSRQIGLFCTVEVEKRAKTEEEI